MRRKRLLFVEQNRDGTVGGSHQGLLTLVEHLDRSLFEPVVGFYERHALLDEFLACSRVVLLPVHEPVRFGNRYGGLTRLAAVATRKGVNLTRAHVAALSRMAQVVTQVRPDLIYLNNGVRPGAEWEIGRASCRERVFGYV